MRKLDDNTMNPVCMISGIIFRIISPAMGKVLSEQDQIAVVKTVYTISDKTGTLSFGYIGELILRMEMHWIIEESPFVFSYSEGGIWFLVVFYKDGFQNRYVFNRVNSDLVN